MTTPVLVTFVPFPVPDAVAFNQMVDRITDLGGTLESVSPMRVGHGPDVARDVVALAISHADIGSLVGRLDNPFEIL